MKSITPDEMTEICRPELLISVAAKHNIALTEEEADTLLGYIEGHELILMHDRDYNLIAFDLQYPWEDFDKVARPCSIKGITEFGIEMAESLYDEYLYSDDLPIYAKSLEVLDRLLEKLLDAESAA